MPVHRNIRLLALHNLFSDFRPFAAIAVVYFAQVSGSFALGMAVFSIAMVSSALFEVPTGIFSDLIGRRRTIILGSIFGFLGITLYAVGGSFWVLALGAVLEGIMRSFFSGNNEAMLHDTLIEQKQSDRFSEILGKTSSMFQVGLASGAAVAVFFGHWPLQRIVWLSVIPQFLCIVISLFFIEPNVHTRESTNVFAHLGEAVRAFRKNPKLRLLSIGSIIQFGVGQSTFFFLPAFVASLWPPWAVAIPRVLNHVFGWTGFWFAGRVIRRWTAVVALLLAVIPTNFIDLFSYAYPNPLSPLLITLGSLGFGVAMISQSTLMQREFTQQQRATMGSLNAFAGSLFLGVCSVVLGAVADRYGPAIALLCAQTAIIPIFAIYWRLYIRHKRSD